MRSIVPSHQKLTTANWDDHWSWSSYNYMRSCWRTQHQQFYSCSECEANWKGKKKLDKWVPHELTTNQKNYFEVLSYCMQQKGIISWLDCDMWQKINFYPTIRDNQLSGSTKKKLQTTFQRNLYQKRLWSLFGGLLSIWSTIAFWILAKPLHLRSRLSKLMRCTKNFSICSWNWST